MAKKNSRDRMSNEINAGSMADIAFLLLIFFLVTTTIAEDKGITVKLPPWSEEDPDITKLKSRNVFAVLVNAQNDLLVRGEVMDITMLREKTKEFIVNPTKREDLSERPTKAIITLKNDRGTNYETYVNVYNELKDEMCLRKYGVKYSEDLPLAWRKSIKDEIPMVLSEAEPTNFGEEK